MEVVNFDVVIQSFCGMKLSQHLLVYSVCSAHKAIGKEYLLPEIGSNT